MNISVIIGSVSLVAVGVYTVWRTFQLYTRLRQQKVRIARSKYFIKIGEITAGQVGEKQLLQVNRDADMAIRKGKGISNFDSEIRPMLESVVNSTKLILDSSISEERRHEIGLDISRTVKKLSDVVENVLLVARIDSERVHYTMESILVSDVVKALYEEYSAYDGSRYSKKDGEGCTLRMVEGRPMLRVKADSVYLSRALREVIKNAFFFSRKGDIFIGWFYHLDTHDVEIFVEDNGIGISHEYLPQVFDVFFKVNNASGGLGLGLPIAKELIEKMNGKISIVSQPNKGTRVSVLLPVAVEED